jgi:hypothetical protein
MPHQSCVPVSSIWKHAAVETQTMKIPCYTAYHALTSTCSYPHLIVLVACCCQCCRGCLKHGHSLRLLGQGAALAREPAGKRRTFLNLAAQTTAMRCYRRWVHELYMLLEQVDARRHVSSALQTWWLPSVPAKLPISYVTRISYSKRDTLQGCQKTTHCVDLSASIPAGHTLRCGQALLPLPAPSCAASLPASTLAAQRSSPGSSWADQQQ